MRRKTILVLNGLAVLGLVLGLSRNFSAQSPNPDRIAGPIAGSSPVWLEGNRRSIFQPENDQGPAPDSLKLENINLMFKLTAEQQADLAALLEQQQDRSSPLYHHWLTPEQFADRFGLSPSDVAKVAAWLQSQGFTITQTARSRLWVSFSGTAGQVQSAFHTEIHHYSVEGKSYYANASEPAVPAVLADVVLGFAALDNYGSKPRSVFREVEAGPNPDFTSNLSGKNFVAPADFAVLYDVNALYTNGIDGTGQSIAVMGQTDLYTDGTGPASDVTKFRSVSGLPANPPVIKLVPGVTDPGVVKADIQEASLDVEWAGAVAKNVKIYYVNGGSEGVYTQALKYAVDSNLAPVITISYGNCEAQWVPAQLQQVDALAKQANSQGQTIVVAAGDSGAADCDGSTSTTTVITSATHGLAVDYPASSPYVTSMGGSEFKEGAGNYWLPAPNGVDVSPSALFYIPEMAWNDTSTTNGLLAGGGGVSTVFPKPPWQTGTGVPNDGFRDVPDLALNASPAHDGYLTCNQGSCVNGYRNPNNTTVPNALTVVGGTSVAVPTFGGIVALINQQMNTPGGQGNINPTLYSMAATSPAAFHDITTGNNIVPCTSGTPDCPASAPFQIGFTAGVGYDQATGLGSIDAYNLVTAWDSSGAGNLPAPTLIAPAIGLAGVGLSPTFTWTAVPNAAGYRILVATSPTMLTTNPALASCSSCAILDTTSGNSATSYTPAAALAANTLYYWEVQAQEPSGSSGTAAWSNVFVFSTGTPDFTLSVSPDTLTMAPGGSGTSTLTLTPIDNFLPGSVTFTCSVASTLAGVTCTVGTLSGNNTATVTITASSTATSYPALPRNPRFGGWWLAGVAVLCFLLITLSRRRQGGLPAPLWNLRHVALGAILAVLLLASLSCGGGGGGGGTPPPPPAESGTVTITGTSTTVTHTAPISVSVS
ncbi:MAG TPA: S53 family peptidase [Terriglobia bacterium]|nr:S53 family peptidase [Terriglobia bacterium]